MLPRRSLVVLAFASLLLGGQARSEPVPPTPEEVARNYVTALKGLRMKDVAARMHPDGLKDIRRKMMATVAYAGRLGHAEAMLPLFHGVPSIAALKKLDDRSFVAATLAGGLRRQPIVKQQFQTATFEVVGHVPQGPNIAHVVCRATLLQSGKWEAGVIPFTLKRTPQGWGVLPSSDLEGLVTDTKRRQYSGADVITHGQIEAYGHLREGREAHIVFRSTAGSKGERVTRVYAFTTSEADVDWDIVVGGNLDALATLISSRLKELQAKKRSTP